MSVSRSSSFSTSSLNISPGPKLEEDGVIWCSPEEVDVVPVVVVVVAAVEDIKEEEEAELSFSLISMLPYPSSFSQMSSSMYHGAAVVARSAAVIPIL